MANSKVSDLTTQATPLATDLFYTVDPTESLAANRSKKTTYAILSAAILATATQITNLDTNLYIQRENSTTWAITRLADGFFATPTNNPSQATAAAAWTNRATLTYSADGT